MYAYTYIYISMHIYTYMFKDVYVCLYVKYLYI